MADNIDNLERIAIGLMLTPGTGLAGNFAAENQFTLILMLALENGLADNFDAHLRPSVFLCRPLNWAAYNVQAWTAGKSDAAPPHSGWPTN